METAGVRSSSVFLEQKVDFNSFTYTLVSYWTFKSNKAHKIRELKLLL